MISKTKQFLTPEIEQKINQLCEWIEVNCENQIGFEELTKHSGFDVNELMTLFGIYKKTTPMGYVRFCREVARKKTQTPTHDLFSRSLLKKPDDLI